jgi:diguanylate cyclase (GGDEF)-like protein
MLAFGVLLALSVSLVRDAAYTGVAMAVVSVVAIACLVVGIRRFRPVNRRFWALCAWALGTSVVAGVLTTVLPPTRTTVALIDGTYLTGYTMLVLAGVLALPTRGEKRDWAGLLDALTLAIAGATLFWYYEVSPTLASAASFHSIVTGVVYPTYDLLLVVVLSRMATSAAPREFPFWMVTVALASSVTTDFWYATTATAGGYVWGSATDAFWVLPMTCLGTAALHPTMRRFAAPLTGEHLRITWIRVFLVGFGAFAVPIVIATQALLSGHLREAMPTVLVGATLLALAGVSRTAEMVRQSRNSAERSQALSEQLQRALDEAEALHGQLVHAALYDPLTGLANRRLFQERLEQALAREGRGCAVLFVDLDDFKNINDSLGHAAGDLALVELARRFAETARSHDTVARLGGDEFAVLLHDDPTPEGATALGRRLLDAVAVPLEIAGVQLELHLSLGVAFSEDAADRDELLRNADIAMYHAKTAGKNQLATYRDDLRRSRLERLDLQVELRTAIDNDELTVVYQPVVDMRDGKVDGVEALVRWFRADGSLFPTPDLIALAEETGLIRPLGRYVLRQATSQVRLWRQRGLSLNIAVNVSGVQLLDPGFVQAAGRAVDALGTDQVLVLELTESAFVGDDERYVDALHELRGMGCRIAIDDFGTGFSSLAYLQQLPVDIVKIPGVFVDDIDRRDDRASVAAAVLGLGLALDYLVVAEGIERPEEADKLRALGCVLGQGYLFARPGTPAEVEPYLVRSCRRVTGPWDAIPAS